jgi:uncharacterized protein (TIGR00255 family)
MIFSMTGFGRSELKQNGLEVQVEIRSLNHRFLEVEIRAPKHVLVFEQEIKDLVRSHLSRGRVNVTIAAKGEEEPTAGLAVDKALAATYIRLLRELQKELKLEGGIKLEQLLTLPDIITYESTKPAESNIWAPLKQAIEMALQDLKNMRLKEGEEIKKDLQSRILGIDAIIKSIEEHSKNKSAQALERLKERVSSLLKLEGLDAGRLEMEVALMADKLDVTEECTRFKSHNALFLDYLENGKSEGRKLNFLLQEMHREANTIGAKANDAAIAHYVVEIKEEVEKLREQVQNLE